MKKNTSLLLLSTLPLMASAQIKTKPNIVWIMAEDIEQDLECYGMKGVKTPNLNRLAEEGMLFQSAYGTGSISSPCRSAMMTGVHQNVINAHNHRSNRELPLTTDVQPITYHLRNNGYTCILGSPLVTVNGRKIDCNYKTKPIGKWDGINNFGLFDKLDEITPSEQPFFAQIQLVKTHRGDWWKETTANSKHPVNPDSIELPPYMPNHPKVRREWATYLDQIEYMDMEVGLIMEDLRKKDLLDNTIIVFIGDNGRCDIRGKGYLYEPGIRIPMIVWGKGIEKGVINDLVYTLDISATILDLAECELPDYLMGKPFLEKKTGRFVGGNEYIFAARDNWDEIIDCMRSITTKDFKYIRNYVPNEGWDRHQQYLDFHRPAIHVMRQLKEENKLDANQLLFMENHKPAEELYNLKNDPYELHNLAEDPAYHTALLQMRGYLKDWQSKYVDYGLKDLNERKTEHAKGGIREYVQKNYPKEWQKLVNGEIGDKFKKFSKEAQNTPDKKQKNNK